MYIGTTTPLVASATFNSGAKLTNMIDRFTGSVFADVSGTIYIEQSGDNSHWDVSTNYAVTGGQGVGFSEEILLPWLRVRFVNGGSDQTAFRIHSRLTKVNPT